MATGTIKKVMDENNIKFPNYSATPTTVTSTGTVRKVLDEDSFILAAANTTALDGYHVIAIGNYTDNLTNLRTAHLFAKKGETVTLFGSTSYASTMWIYPLL